MNLFQQKRTHVLILFFFFLLPMVWKVCGFCLFGVFLCAVLFIELSIKIDQRGKFVLLLTAYIRESVELY